MKEIPNGNQGSELHRLREMPRDYDVNLFNRLYKVCTPVIRNISKQIDCKRVGVTRDIIQSYMWDKVLFVFTKYYGTCTEEHLKARILSSLSLFKTKLMRAAYGLGAEFNQSLRSFEDLFDDSKEDYSPIDSVSDEEGSELKSKMLNIVHNYIEKNVDPDTALIWEVILYPPEYIKDLMEKKNYSKVTNEMLIDFFDLPKSTNSMRFISNCRDNIQYWTERAKKELPFELNREL